MVTMKLHSEVDDLPTVSDRYKVQACNGVLALFESFCTFEMDIFDHHACLYQNMHACQLFV